MKVDPIDIRLTATDDATVARVVIHDETTGDRIKEHFRDRLTSEEGELAYIIEAPQTRGLWRLLDRSGLTIARARTPEDLASSAISHLSALADSHNETLGIRCRALAHVDGTVTLLSPPFGRNPALIERRLSGAGLAVLDRAVLPISTTGSITAWATGLHSAEGHAATWEDSLSIRRVVVPSTPDTPSVLAAGLASNMMGPRTEVLEVAATLAQQTDVVEVDPSDRGALYVAL